MGIRAILAAGLESSAEGGVASPQGDDPSEPTEKECRLQDMLRHGSMPEIQAKKILLGIDSRDLTSREDIVECLAALVKLFPEEVEKKATDGRTLRLILSTFAAPVRLERLLNFRRARQHIVRKDVDYLAIGTTTNEALHRELNRAFDQVHNYTRLL